MTLAVRLSVSYALFQYVLRLLDELTVQIDSVSIDSTHGIVLPKDIVRGLFVILVHHCTVSLSLLGKFVGRGTIASFVSIVGLPEVSTATKMLRKMSRRLCRGKTIAYRVPDGQEF